MKTHEFDVQLRQDGNMWCATFHDFTDLQNSPAGFGETPILAITELQAQCNGTDMARLDRPLS